MGPKLTYTLLDDIEPSVASVRVDDQIAMNIEAHGFSDEWFERTMCRGCEYRGTCEEDPQRADFCPLRKIGQ